MNENRDLNQRKERKITKGKSEKERKVKEKLRKGKEKEEKWKCDSTVIRSEGIYKNV